MHSGYLLVLNKVGIKPNLDNYRILWWSRNNSVDLGDVGIATIMQMLKCSRITTVWSQPKSLFTSPTEIPSCLKERIAQHYSSCRKMNTAEMNGKFDFEVLIVNCGANFYRQIPNPGCIKEVIACHFPLILLIEHASGAWMRISPIQCGK